jgi:hypothetical protein
MSDKTKPEPKWVSPEDACAIGGFGMTRCYEMMNDGTLISKKLGTRRLIYVDSINTAGEFIRPSEAQHSRQAMRGRRTRLGTSQTAA